jgi:alcohol dehydrogenase
VTIGFAARAISLAIPALRALAEDLGDTSARDALSEASLLAGLCISQTWTALCHSMSYPLTAHFGISHGYACAFSMAEVFAIAHQHTPGLFDPVIAHTGHQGPESLLEDIRSLIVELGVAKVVADATTSIDDLVALRGEMFTPGRSDNFVAPVDEAVVEAVVRASYH